MEVLHEWVDKHGVKRKVERWADAEYVQMYTDRMWHMTPSITGLYDSLKRYTNAVNPSQPQIISNEWGMFLIEDGKVYKWDGTKWVLTERDDLIFDTPETP